MRDLRDKRVIWVGVSEERANGEEDLGYGQCGAPLLLEDVKANAPIRVDVWVINLYFSVKQPIGLLERKINSFKQNQICGAISACLSMQVYTYISINQSELLE